MAETVKERFVNKKCCVIIPTYNNHKSLEGVINGVLQYTDNIIIVNDGSTDSTSDILKKYAHLEIVSVFPNRGKGNALKNGFRKALSLGYKYAITIDSDGQHSVDDLIAFLDKLDEEPNAVIIGARNMAQDGVPKKSSFGHKFSNFWFWFETGIKMPDTQSGFRLYPLAPIKKMKFYTLKYEFEIEIIVRLAWKGVKVLPVPIKVFYTEERVTHFRPIKDFARVSVLNTVLVLVSILIVKPFQFIRSLNKKNIKEFFNKNLIQSKDSDFKKSATVAFGVFMGVSPLWGYQMLSAVGLAYLLRLNKILVLVSANISIPPLIPFIIWGGYKTGSLFFTENTVDLGYSSNLDMTFIKANLLQYIVGSLVFGALLGLFFGLLTFVLLKTFVKKKPVVK